MHCRSSPMEKHRDRSRRRRETLDGLRFSRADGFLAGRRHDDDRTDRERIERGTRSFLRCDDFNPRGDRCDREWKSRPAKQFAQKRAAHCATNRFRKMGPFLLARASRLPRAVDTRTQILAVSCENRQRLRRPKSFLLLPADRRFRPEIVRDFSTSLEMTKGETPDSINETI